MKKPKPVKLKYGEYKGHVIKACTNRDDRVTLPAIEANETYMSLDEYIWSIPENARDIAGFLVEWADWAEDYLKANPKRNKWLLAELAKEQA